MTETVLQLRSHEVWSALEVIDPVATMAEYLISRTVSRAGHGRQSPGRLISWSDTGLELVLLDHPDATGPCVVPARSLRSSQTAALAAVAAREMLVPGGVTMAMLGPMDETQSQLSLVARHVADISHVALCGTGPGATELEPKLVDQLELSGIGLSVVPTVADAVFGANLVITSNHAASTQDLTTLGTGRLARGALLVNATGRDLPPDLVAQVDEIYVDDLGLLDRYPDRQVVAGHLAEPTTRRGREAAVVGDLAQLLAGGHPGRRRPGDTVLVELLGVRELNVDLAYRIYEAARHTGLGVRVRELT